MVCLCSRQTSGRQSLTREQDLQALEYMGNGVTMPVNTSLAFWITKAVKERSSLSNGTSNLLWVFHKTENRQGLLWQTSPPGIMPGHTLEPHPHDAASACQPYIPQASWQPPPLPFGINSFHDIRNTVNTPLSGRNVQRAQHFFQSAGFRHPGIGPFMKHVPLCRELVLLPCAFQMNQSTLPGTVQVMLQCRQGYGEER